MSNINKKNLLSDKITDILSTTPGQLDPEDDIYEETAAQVTHASEDEEHEESLSKFRKQNVDLLEDVDSRYMGKKASRKSLQDSDEDWETEDEGLSTDEGEALDGVSGTQELGSEEEMSSDEADKSEESDEFGSDYQEDESDFKHLSDVNVTGQMKKGNAVRNQLSIWENLLEIRIQLQKCLLSSNKLPQHDKFSEFNSKTDYKSAVKTTKKNLSNMLEKFLTLQSSLLKQYSETKKLLQENNEEKTNEDSDEEIPSDTEEEKSESDESGDEIPKKKKKVSEFEFEIKTRHQKYKIHRNNTIQKWNDKTRLAIGKHNTGANNTILQQIDYLLGDKQKLLKRTQMKKSEFEVIGKKKEKTDDNTAKDEFDTEIYDDTDFYHQLLRELIEVKSGDVTDPVQMSRQWIQLQKLRSKMKRKIDTKATKGRKIRYVVHSKLVNFMAPISENTWMDEAKNELYSSLFGNNAVK